MSSTSPKRPEHRPDQAPPAPSRRPNPTRADESDAHQGATEEQVGERGGSGPGFDQEPKKERRKGGVES
jgi:hypothetical protein